MAFAISPVIGADVTNTLKATDITAGAIIPFALGTQAWGSDGKLYVFCKANASISATTTVCTVNAATFLATATAGSYTSPATAMVTGDYGWFFKTSV